jgi:uncharacterized protein (TIGR00299 family) protein
MRLLHIDAFAGISGDMSVSALRDLGVPEHVFLEAISALKIALPDCRFERGDRNGISGWRFIVGGHDAYEGAEATHDHDLHSHTHSHTHGGHEHHSQGHDHKHGRNHSEIVELINGSALHQGVKSLALAVFHRIAVAEGAVHGVPPEHVGFHEVGAEDSIADIICTCAGLVHLGVDHVSCGPLIEGSGHVHCAHGTFPLPAPATLGILKQKGIPFRQVDEPWEHLTPTGAAILTEVASSFGPMPEMAVTTIGYGLGSRRTPNRPNALRLILGESIDSSKEGLEEVVELRCNLDDLTPEHAASALDSLINAGALDATLTPTVMKKGRSGWILEVLTQEDKAAELSELILRQTSAFGVRRHRMERLKLERHFEEAETRFGTIRIKVGTLRGEVIQRSPEFSSCSEAANLHGVSARVVHNAALQALGQ